MPSLRKLISDYLKEARLMQLGTSIDDQPWVCNVWFASDTDLNIYFLSALSRRHSKEIEANPNVAGAIALPQTPSDRPRGIQFQGVCERLVAKADIDKALSLYGGRIFPRDVVLSFMDSEDYPHRFYRIRPKFYVLYDAVNFPDSPRRELEL